MTPSHKTLIVFTIDGQRYGVDLWSVSRVVRVVEITPVPDVPEKVLGIINFAGTLIPVISTRNVVGAPERDPELSDKLVILRDEGRMTALLVDGVDGALRYGDAEEIPMESVIPGTTILRGILKGKEDLVFIQDTGRFLSLEEIRMVESALDTFGRPPDHG